MGRGAWRVQAAGDGRVETTCLPTAAALDALGAVRDGHRVEGRRTVLIYDVRGLADALRERASSLEAAANGGASGLTLVQSLLGETFVGRFATAFYAARRHAKKRAGGEP